MRQLTRLIDNGVNPNVRDYDQRTAFHIAARRGCLKVVDYLVSCKAEINAVDRYRDEFLADTAVIFQMIHACYAAHALQQ